MFQKTSLLITLALALFISACAGTKKTEQVVESSGGSVNAEQATPWGDDSNAWGTGYTIDQLRALGIDKNPLEYTTVYFQYDSAQIDERSQIIVTAHAQFLATQPSQNVTLEGHTDERGTREYNLSLGERRAVTVRDLMNSIGAGNQAISAVTYGEERPVSTEQNEEAWQSNRRVQILY